MSWKKICSSLTCCKKKVIKQNPYQVSQAINISVAQVRTGSNRSISTAIDIHGDDLSTSAVECIQDFNGVKI